MPDARRGRHARADLDGAVAVDVPGAIEFQIQRLIFVLGGPVEPIERLGSTSFDAVFKDQVAGLLRCFEAVAPDVFCRGQADGVFLGRLRLETIDYRKPVEAESIVLTGPS